MRKKIYAMGAAAGFAIIFFFASSRTEAYADNFKLPYAAGQSFVVAQGYDSPPTHVGKDEYALDLTENGCDAYGKAAVAAAGGRVMLAAEEGYNGGYGTEALIVSDGGLVERYAHLIPGTIDVGDESYVTQGEVLGRIGDTGLVAGTACAAHPGTHIHFAVDRIMPDGTYAAYDAEPISGYVDITEGHWYLSDNAPGAVGGNNRGGSEESPGIAPSTPSSTPSVPSSSAPGLVLGASVEATGTAATSSPAAASSSDDGEPCL
jgi:hypothetical protein